MATSVRLRRVGFAAAALASVFLLAACSPPTSAAESYAGQPQIEDPLEENETPEPESPEGEPQAEWLQQGGQIAVTLYGSSSCPQVGTDIRVLEPAGQGNSVEIEVAEIPEDQICTADFVPHTTVFWTPQNVSATEVLTVHVADTEIEVPVK